MARTPRSQRIITGFLIISALLAFLYVSASITLALVLAYRPPRPITRTPSSLGLSYREITFYSREDHLKLRGWFIPGILPDGRLTVERTVIQVHGANSNRAFVLDMNAALVQHGIAVLTFDTRGNGESAASLVMALAAPARGSLQLTRVVKLPIKVSESAEQRKHTHHDSVDTHAKDEAIGEAKAYLANLVDHLLQGPLKDANLTLTWSVAVGNDVAGTLIRVAETGEVAPSQSSKEHHCRCAENAGRRTKRNSAAVR